MVSPSLITMVTNQPHRGHLFLYVPSRSSPIFLRHCGRGQRSDPITVLILDAVVRGLLPCSALLSEHRGALCWDDTPTSVASDPLQGSHLARTPDVTRTYRLAPTLLVSQGHPSLSSMGPYGLSPGRIVSDWAAQQDTDCTDHADLVRRSSCSSDRSSQRH